MKIKLFREDRQRLLSIREKIDRDYKDDFTLQQLAREFKINDYKLRHGFKQIYGMSIPDYQEKKRMECFFQSIEGDEEMTIAAAAYAAGYNSISTFNRAFRKRFRMTPTQWMQKNGHVQAALIFIFSLYGYLYTI